jgi:hypothetical protein
VVAAKNVYVASSLMAISNEIFRHVQICMEIEIIVGVHFV